MFSIVLSTDRARGCSLPASKASFSASWSRVRADLSLLSLCRCFSSCRILAAYWALAPAGISLGVLPLCLPSLRPPSLTLCRLVPLTEVHPPHPKMPFESGSWEVPTVDRRQSHEQYARLVCDISHNAPLVSDFVPQDCLVCDFLILDRLWSDLCASRL